MRRSGWRLWLLREPCTALLHRRPQRCSVLHGTQLLGNSRIAADTQSLQQCL